MKTTRETVRCTHRGLTAEHVANCCADGMDCELCFTTIPRHQVQLTDAEILAGAVILCTDCKELTDGADQ